MVSKTYYRKYRPQNLSQLDLADIRQRLITLVKSKNFPHALLFSGPKGTGKTSAARILAKTINCQNKKGFEPCNECEICQGITNGSALDLIEIDAASNRGIDDIRALREKIGLSPAQCQYKVYIIDEVHMLTTEAFNALLKTLEEPPEHAIFILCTTEPEKLPETVISRCVRFNFVKAHPKNEIERSLKRVVEGEKLELEKGVLEAIAQSADGSFRDAQKILEQLAMAGQKITLGQTQKLLQQTEELKPDKFLALLSEKKIKAAFVEIDRVVSAGADLTIFSQQILDQLRLSLLAKVGLTDVAEPQSTADFNLEQIKQLIEFFSHAYQEIKFSPIPQLPLEMAVVEFCGFESSSEPNQSKQAESAVQQSKPKKNIVKIELPSGGNGDLEKITANWEKILTEVRPLNHSVQALLRACRPAGFDGRTLTLEVFYKFHKERLETEKCRQIIEQVSGQVLGAPVRMACVLGVKETVKNNRAAQNSSGDDIIELAENIFN